MRQHTMFEFTPAGNTHAVSYKTGEYFRIDKSENIFVAGQYGIGKDKTTDARYNILEPGLKPRPHS